ncbi:SDR family oxidoreductase [Roseomonas sp. 18066]|uniref:SDR family oxidoreductase n=1 Tax=Roseomonas sp. 18066 TaxID=2681412 RepID=UPI00135CB547|nr:SDR family oxidoreductase [Roseomonas sp. 18066]
MSVRWTSKDMPSQRGRTIVVTGTGGLGFESGLALARAGGDVIIAGRNPARGEEAVARIRKEVPGAAISFERLDLADLRSIAACGQRLTAGRERIDVLINNAGVMTPPRREVTADGFELQFGTNYLGHFALTAHLMPLLRRGRDPRVVTLSSVAARGGRIDFDDLHSQQRYKPMRAYSQSKLACLIFAFELQRRSDQDGCGVTSIAAHPGVSRTDLLHNAPGRFSAPGLARSLLWFLFQPAAQGALPALFAATAREARKGGYYGPDRLGETRGYPVDARSPTASLDPVAAGRLWDRSVEMTGAMFGHSRGDAAGKLGQP